jgi:DNA-binding transcriptional MerR regulator
MAKSVLDAGWGMLRAQLQYKGQQAGRSVFIVNERNTTRTCSNCRSLTGPTGLDMLVVRAWVCSECGVTHDRDVNAARNILFVGRSSPSVRGNKLSSSVAPPSQASRLREAKNQRIDGGGMNTGLRYYEREALLPAPARAAKRRMYDSQVIGRIRIIQLARCAGFSIAETRAFIGNFPSGSIPSARWQAMANRKVKELDELIARATQMKSLLRSSFRCGCSTIEDCERLMIARNRKMPAIER